MWRGYGGDGNGVAIVIDPKAFGFPDNKVSEIQIAPVFYETDNEFADRVVRYFNEFKQTLISCTAMERECFKSDIAYAFGELCFYLAVTHKDPRFRPEKEWRFIYRERSIADPEFSQYIEPKVLGDHMAEYFCLPIAPNPRISPEEDLLPQTLIKEIMIGPIEKERSEIVARGIERLVERCGFSMDEPQITFSTIPYRTRRF